MTASFCNHLDAYLDGTLAAADRAQFEAHLATCASCPRKVEQWQSFAGAFKESTKPMLVEPSPGEVARLMAKVDEPRRSARPLVFGLVGLAAAVAIGVFAVTRPERPLEALVDGQPLIGDEVATLAEEQTLEVSGATVAVSTRSSLKVLERSAKAVRLELATGAVKLKVSRRQKGQAFVVRSAAWDTFVVGTAFSVSRVGDVVEVHVDEGQVRVSSGTASFDVPAGKTFRAVGTKGGLVEPVAEVKDAGVQETAELVEEPAAPKATDVADPQLTRWRAAAVKGQCGVVIPQARSALQRFPRSAQTWLVLADCERLTNADGDAIRSYGKVVVLGARDDADRARLLLADLHQQKSQHAEAERVLRGYLSHPQPPQLEAAARVRLARSLIAQGQKQKARAELERVTEKLPKTSSALQALELLKGL
jgi:ferric-dicitrate binding protein FerR (iron transport regulator)